MEKIDFVIPWVDGNDPQWRAEKAKYDPSGMPQSDAPERYRDWDNLQYWFRGVEKFAPWVNRIHFITWGHLPPWLDTSNPKLNIVKHTDYIPEKYLPTFSSHAIELNMHRIEGLAEHFVFTVIIPQFWGVHNQILRIMPHQQTSVFLQPLGTVLEGVPEDEGAGALMFM